MLALTESAARYYTGYTLDTRDEIDSQVVVDFSEALANEARRKWTPKIDSLRTAPDKGDVDEKCSAACCIGQGVGDDKYIDSRLTEDFVKSLLPDRSLGAPSLLLSPRPLEETQVNEPTEDEYVVMTYRVFAFVLRSRKWAQLDLTFLRYQNNDARDFTLSAFDQLALPDGHRDMVESLVTQHFRDRKSNSNEQTDIVKGKGKGLILLLHGAPGVGKTTTAEGVAERFQKPLFQITCGDLGNTARDVEGELEKNFSLASRWGCILLLDEADVFLSARERKDFERNGLVAGKAPGHQLGSSEHANVI
jgi:Cdc6-like AAA superfamily ATPase